MAEEVLLGWGMRKEPALRSVKWDVSWYPDLSSPFLPLSSTSTHCLLHLLGEQLVTDLLGVVPLGRIHPAASLKSLSTWLLSFHLGRLPRVAAREMGEVVGTGESMFYEQLNFYMWLTVVHCDTESSSLTVWLSHLSDSVGLSLRLETKQKLTRIINF